MDNILGSKNYYGRWIQLNSVQIPCKKNIGFDGSGEHCGNTNVEQRIRSFNDLNDIVLPDKIELPMNYREAYDGYFSWISLDKKLACYNNIMTKWIKNVI